METSTPTNTPQPTPTPTNTPPPMFPHYKVPKKTKNLFLIAIASVLVLAISGYIIFILNDPEHQIAAIQKNALYESVNSGGMCGYTGPYGCSSGQFITQNGDIVIYPGNNPKSKYSPTTTGKIDDSTLNELKDLSTQVSEKDLTRRLSGGMGLCDSGTTEKFIYNLTTKEWVTLLIDIDCSDTNDKINDSPAARRIREIISDVDWGYN